MDSPGGTGDPGLAALRIRRMVAVDPATPGFHATTIPLEAREAVRLYVEVWVLPLIEATARRADDRGLDDTYIMGQAGTHLARMDPAELIRGA
ncbi:MAG: hypothetical protein KDB61_14495 [Planctomycetes bacterium]|nr:hypothetical protein [Planctomycetota bacterium]